MDKEQLSAAMREVGSRGGKATAKKYSAEQLSKWGKMGGRPKSAPKKRVKKKARS